MNVALVGKEGSIGSRESTIHTLWSRSYFNLSTATSRIANRRQSTSTRNTTISAEEVYQGLSVINRPTRGFARRGSLEIACFESGGECISFVDRDCPHQLKAKGFGLCGSVGKSVLEGTKCSSVPKKLFSMLLKTFRVSSQRRKSLDQNGR